MDTKNTCIASKRHEIMVVQQIPVISERLASVKQLVNDRVGVCKDLACTEETRAAVKKFRTELKAEFDSYETQRKAIKTAVMQPYEDFERVYKDCVSDAYTAADRMLKQKIDAVENELKERKRAEVQTYFEELLAVNGIDFVSFSQSGINITLSASMKSLKEQAKDFVQRIADDLAMIETQEHRTDILVEYKKTLNCSAAIMTVNARHAAIAEELKRQRERQESSVQQKPAPKPAPLPPPAESGGHSQAYTVRFTVTGTKEQLRSLKKFLNDGGYHYE